MKFALSLLIIFSISIEAICQTFPVAGSSYKITCGNYLFEVKSEFTKQTSYELDLSSSCNNYSKNEKPYLKTILFIQDTFTIPLPETIDTILFLNCETAEEQMIILARNHITINKLIDTITLEELKTMLEKDIAVIFGNVNMENVFFGGMIIEDSGKKRGISNQFAADRSRIIEQINYLSSGGYFIISGIFYQNNKKNFGVIEGAIGWKIM